MSVQIAMHVSHRILFVLQACSALVDDRHSTSDGVGWSDLLTGSQTAFPQLHRPALAVGW